MGYRRLITFAICAFFSALMARAQDSAASTNELQWLRQKVEELEQKVRALENANKLTAQTNQPEGNLSSARASSNANAADAGKSKPTPEVSIGAEGFSLTSADRDFALQIKGVLQLDSRTFFNDG